MHKKDKQVNELEEALKVAKVEGLMACMGSPGNFALPTNPLLGKRHLLVNASGQRWSLCCCGAAHPALLGLFSERNANISLWSWC